MAMVKMDVTNIQYADSTFDMILCSHVLEHIPDDRQAMCELFRVLKPKGFALIMVPITVEKTFEDLSVTSPAQREELFDQADHVRLYGWDFKDRLEGTGFSTTTFTAAEIVGKNKAFRFDVQPKHDAVFSKTVFICEKNVV